MNTDSHKLNQTLADELQVLQQENAQLKKQLVEMAQQHTQLRRQLDDQCREVEVEQAAKSRNIEALQLAELIIDNSPVILFRRLAAANPKLRKMVYVSPNISRFGYKAEDFLSGRMMFRNILYPEDFDQTLKEIQSYVSRNGLCY